MFRFRRDVAVLKLDFEALLIDGLKEPAPFIPVNRKSRAHDRVRFILKN